MSSKKDESMIKPSYMELKTIINGENGTYRLDNKKIIGKGAFSTVYFGINVETYEKVAIKKYFCNRTDTNAHALDVIEREIKIVSYLMKHSSHENLVRYFDVVRTRMVVYIIMEYCAGGTFSSLFVKPMKEKYVQYYFKQLMEGLKALHNMNIIHRDIKPDNILLANDYRTIKICDFGFSYLINNDSNDSLDNTVYGSPIYMAPENFITNTTSNVSNIDTKSDIWSAGIILYEMIYGYHPCRGSKDIKTIQVASHHININNYDDLDVNNNGINLLRNMLNLDNVTRITIDNIIESLWLKSFDIEAIKEIVLSDIFKPNRKESRQSKSLPSSFSQNKNYLDHKYKDHRHIVNKDPYYNHLNDGSFDLIIKEHNKNNSPPLNKSNDDAIFEME